ncbi:hypothetical protein ACA910_007989 [Epithemia clementina (nom. ined.)]
MAQAEPASLFECFKTVFNLNLFSQSVSVPVSLSVDDPRILRAADVFFDQRIHSALEILQQQYLFQHEELLIPPLETSLSSDESSSTSCSSDDDVIQELLEISARPPRSRVSRDTMKRSRDTPRSFQGSNEEEVRARRTAAMNTLKTSGNEHRLALTLTGSKGINQDCGMVVHPLLKERSEPTMLLGVLDGHASMGHVVSEHCRRHLEKSFTSGLASNPIEGDVAGRLVKMVEEVDQDIPGHLSLYGGTTLSSVLQLGDDIYLVNTGDSMSMVCAYVPKLDQCVVLETTERHVPELPQERSRILRAGGWISPQGYVLYEVDDDEYGLGMSRSLGDRGAPGVVATPDVKTLSITKLKERVANHFQADSAGNRLRPDDILMLGVSVSDGVLDVADANELASCLTQAFFGSPSLQSPLHPMVAVEHMIQTCAQRWQEEYSGEYRDDITIVAAKLL